MPPTHSVGAGPPLSITVPKHRLPHHSGLRLQLLYLLQQCFFAGMLGPVSQGKDKKHMTHETYTAVETVAPFGVISGSPLRLRLWLRTSRNTLTVPAYGQGSTFITWEASQVLRNTLGP